MKFYVQLFAVTALAAVSIAAGQTIDINNIVMQNFVDKFKQTPVTPTTLPTVHSRNLVPSGSVSPISDCTTNTGKEGFCVRKAACQDGNPVTSGKNIIIIRSMIECPDTEVCCELKRQTTTPDDTGVPSSPVGSGAPWSPVGPGLPSTTVGPAPGVPWSPVGSNVPSTPVGSGVPSAPFGQGVPPTPFKPGPPWAAPPPPTTPGNFSGIRQKLDVPRQGCGWRNENGIGNDTDAPDGYAKPGEFPWMVKMVKVDRFGRDRVYIYIGGGFLIHQKVVLTAAHVIASEDVPTRLHAILGNYDNSNTTALTKFLKKVELFDIHEYYRQGAYEYDIALIIIKKPVQWLPHIGYICLPQLNAPVIPGTRCFTSGWGTNSENGHNSVMGKAEIPVLPLDSCLTSLYYENSVYQNAMCAGGEVDKDTCKGDEGSPLACPIEGQPGRYMASGVLSWRMSCGFDGKPSVYVDVARYRQWIDNKMIQHGFSIDSYTQY